MKLITWVDLDGRFRITTVAYNDKSNKRDETEEQALARAWEKVGVGFNLPKTHACTHVEYDVLVFAIKAIYGDYFRYSPLDNTSSWEMGLRGMPKINIAKAKAIHMDHIRIERNKILKESDVTMLNVMEKNEDVSGYTTYRQSLRDIPQTIALPDDIDALKATWPALLNQP